MSWYACQKTLAEQASKALFAVKSKLNQFGPLSINVLFKIFDSKILPILTYGSEVWFGHESMDIERVHHDFCKYVLKITRQAPNAFVRGELGRYRIYNTRCMKLIKYWLRLLHLPNSRFPKVCYKLQCKWLDAKTQTNCWAREVRDVLLRSGFCYAWYNQGVGNERLFLRNFEQKLTDIDISFWYSEVENMSRLRTYRILKARFCCESFLQDNLFQTHKQILVKFRGGLLDFRVNTGRFESVPYDQRICPICKSEIENEYHFLLVCPYYDHLRQKFIPSYFFVYPSEIKFKMLMNLNNTQLRLKLCQYLISSLKLRAEILSGVYISI